MEIQEILEKDYCNETIFEFLSFVDLYLSSEFDDESYARIIMWAQTIVAELNFYICELSKANRSELEKIITIIFAGINKTVNCTGNVPARRIYLMFPNFHDFRFNQNYTGISDQNFKQQGW